MTEDKTVYSIDNFGAYAYLSTAFGVMKVNVKDIEISDTYNLGFRVDYTYLEGDYIYAASSSRGLYRGLQTDSSPPAFCDGAADDRAIVPPKAPSPLVDVPTPRCICTLPSSEA